MEPEVHVYNVRVRRVVLTSALLLLLVGSGHAEGLRVLALPSSRGHAQLEHIAQEVGQRLSSSLSLPLLDTEPSQEFELGLREGLAKAQAGSLEEAARALQVVASLALDAPHTLGPDTLLLPAMTELASIALAAGDNDRADSWFARILELDPAFALEASQRSPRVDASLQRARARVGESASSLGLSAVGSACADGASVLIVARGLRDGALELVRFDHCRLAARVRGTGASKPEDLAAALDPSIVEKKPGKRPFYKSGWFWAGASATLVAGTIATLVLFDDEQPQLQIRPIL